jgi:hypothetical protein
VRHEVEVVAGEREVVDVVVARRDLLPRRLRAVERSDRRDEDAQLALHAVDDDGRGVARAGRPDRVGHLGRVDLHLRRHARAEQRDVLVGVLADRVHEDALVLVLVGDRRVGGSFCSRLYIRRPSGSHDGAAYCARSIVVVQRLARRDVDDAQHARLRARRRDAGRDVAVVGRGLVVVDRAVRAVVVLDELGIDEQPLGARVAVAHVQLRDVLVGEALEVVDLLAHALHAEHARRDRVAALLDLAVQLVAPGMRLKYAFA